MKISIGADHAGVDVHDALVKALKEQGYEVTDHGTHSHDSVDYPDYAHPVAKDVATGKADYGILVCSTGIGMSIAANKVKGIRAALAYNEDAATFARKHNNANVLCMGQKFVDPKEAITLADIFLKTNFDGGRHERRVEKLEQDIKY